MATVSADMARLELILRELGEAVVACDAEGRILFFNPAARRLFGDSSELALGRSLYKICRRAPLDYTIRLLLQRQAQRKPHPETRESRFVCMTVKDARLLLCNMSLIGAPRKQQPFFIVSFEEATKQLEGIRQENRLLEKIIAELRSPLANLCAAAENLKNHPGMDEEMRLAFEQVMIKESEELKHSFELFVLEAQTFPSNPWPLRDVYSADLIGCVVHALSGKSALHVTMTGVPLWLHADTYPLTMALVILLQKISETKQVTAVDMEALLGDLRVYIDIVWQGDAISAGTIEDWQHIPLPDAILDMTVGDVLNRHGSEIWSQSHHLKGCSLLRISAPISNRQWAGPTARTREQPIYYDFSLLDSTADLGELANRPLSSLNYVVFDTETTGISPEGGDEILSISAVRIVDGRILSEESFASLVQPQRPLKDDILAIYGLSNESLQNKPRIKETLQQFLSFAGDAVLVAHNAAFDMKFIRHMGDSTGVKLTNPLLDTLLLFSIVAPDQADRTLSGIGRKLGIETSGRFTALGDTLVTAQIFLVLVELLRQRDIATLGEAIEASEEVLAKRGH